MLRNLEARARRTPSPSASLLRQSLWGDVETSYRPMTDREAAELRALVSPSTAALRIGLFALALAAVAYLMRGLQTLVVTVPGVTDLPLWLVPTLVVGAALYVLGGRWTGGPELRKKVRRDLERREIARHRVRVVGALEAPEVEDEGPVFFVQDDRDGTMFFAGQEMARYKTRGFPWVEFEILEAPESGRLFGLRPLGEPLSNVPVRAPLSLGEAKALGTTAARFGKLDKELTDLRKDA